MEDSKDHKHNPSSLAIDEVIFKEDKMIVRYTEKGTSTVLFDYNEKFRSFSLSTDKNGHIKNFRKQLTCEWNLICYYENSYLDILKRKEFTNNDKYDLDDIVYKKVHTNYNNFEYYLSICPIYSFIYQISMN